MTGRTVSTSVIVRDSDGTALTDASVVVEQVSHAFGFGNIGFDLVAVANDDAPDDGLAELFTDVFNVATLPFYWGDFEPVAGRPSTQRLLTAARWLAARGITLKGHPLVWHTMAPGWLRSRTTTEVAETVGARVRREVGDFAGLIDTWDAINEVVIMPVFDNEPAGEGPNAITRLCWERGRLDTARLAFESAREANPAAKLLINDFDLSTAYECLIEGLLEAGVRIDAIGLQSHMHQGYWGEERTLRIIERFARYGLPLHWTETTLVSGDLMPAHIEDLNDFQPASWPSTAEGEERQADEVERHYRTLCTHPAVEAVTYWGITDRGAWLGAPAGLVRIDGSPKPAYERLRGLVREEWWLPATTLRTDHDGRVEVAGWAGDYRVSVGDGSATVALTGGSTEVSIRR